MPEYRRARVSMQPVRAASAMRPVSRGDGDKTQSAHWILTLTCESIASCVMRFVLRLMLVLSFSVPEVPLLAWQFACITQPGCCCGCTGACTCGCRTKQAATVDMDGRDQFDRDFNCPCEVREAPLPAPQQPYPVRSQHEPIRPMTPCDTHLSNELLAVHGRQDQCDAQRLPSILNHLSVVVLLI